MRTAQWLTLVATEAGSLRSTRRFATELALQPEKRFIQQLFEHRISTGFEKIFVPHESVKQHMIEDGYDPELFDLVPNRLSETALDRVAGRNLMLAQLKLPSDSKIAGTVAPLIPKARLKDLIWATDLLTCIRDDVHLVIFGVGKQKSRLRKFASQTESAAHVHFLDQPTNARKMLGGLDFFWHSHLLEPLPGSLMLAMASGIPVISVFGPGTSEMVRDQETGFAVNVGGKDEFARWTKYLIELPDSARQLATQSQEFALRKFGNGTQIDKYLRAYGLQE